MQMRVEGVISLQAVVLPDGSTGTITVNKCDLKSRLQDSTNKDDAPAREALLRSQFKAGGCTETFGLETEAIRALKRWRFTAGTRNGVPVPVQVEIEMSFALR
jgi:hypothetical protein